MNEGSQHLPDHEDQRACVQRYEAMRSRNAQQFFDVEEFELIIDHYLENNEPKRAREVLDFAKQLHPGALDLQFCEAQVLMSAGRLNKALEVLDAIERMEPLNEEIHLHKASIYSQLRNYRRAVDHYKRALELADEGLDEIYLDLAFEHENLEEFDEAIDCLKKAVDLNPENEAVLYELAYCFDLANAAEASIAYFKAFTDQHPYAFVAWYNLGNAFAQLERWQESLDALDLCLAIDDHFSSAYFSKARTLLLMGRYQEAIDCYEETLAFDGPQAVTFSYIGECFEKMERYEEALLHYDRSLALDPNWVDAWIGRGVVKDVQERLPEAIKDLEMAIRIAPENADAWYYYANVLGRSQRYEEAFTAFEKVNLLGPQSLEGWMDHADLLMNVKSPEAALKKFREAEMVHKLNAKYKYRLVSYLLRAGREQQALLELEEALMLDHAEHTQLLEHYPEAAQLPQVLHLLELYRR
jgi:tetratricopeptide (TPR) repeat protein